MRRIERSAIVPHGALALYEIVDDVESYPKFLPWCLATRVIARTPVSTTAELAVGLKGIRQSFITENANVPGVSIDMRLVQGPFRRFTAGWRFKALSPEAARIEYFMDCEFSSLLLAKTLEPLFERIADTMVDAFTRRADALHGENPR